MRAHQHSEQGFTLVSVMLLAGVLGLLSLGTYQVFHQQLDLLRIVRMQQRLSLLEKKLINTARSYGAMRATAALHPNSTLARCFGGRECFALASFEPLPLVDAVRQPLSGLYDLNGRPCTGSCPIEVRTELKLVCGDGSAKCELPSEIQTRYTIRKASPEQIKGREFKELTGVVSLSAFACPSGQYIRAVTGDGQLICDESFISANGNSCPPKMAAVGIDSAGFLKCRDVVDYCASPLGLATVLDTSASMKTDFGIDAAKLGLSAFVERLRANQDQGSFVSFNSEAALRQDLTSNIGALAQAIRREEAAASTDMVAGLTKAGETLAGFNKGQKVMIFVSDGFHNGAGDPVAAAAQLKAQGIRILTVGFSRRADTRMLQRIASSPQDFYNAAEIGNLNRVLSALSELTCR